MDLLSRGRLLTVADTNAFIGFRALAAILILIPLTPAFAQSWAAQSLPASSFNGAALSGKASSTLILGVVSSNLLGNYSVVVANGYGSVTSSIATLALAQPPVIILQPQSQVVATGQVAVFTVKIIGSGPLSYQWFKNSTPLAIGGQVAGANSNVLTISGVGPANCALYSVSVGNAIGNVTSGSASLTLQGTDKSGPTLVISSPRPNSKVTDGALTVSGTAKHALGVACVWTRLNGADWILARTADNWATWSADLTLSSYTNVIEACAMDASGVFSAIKAVTVDLVQLVPLVVQTNGPGTVPLIMMGRCYKLAGHIP
jgi:hypothetical protein